MSDQSVIAYAAGRAELVPTWPGDAWELNVHFNSVERGLDLAVRTNRVVVVVGANVHEETKSYVDRIGRYVDYITLLVDSSGNTLFSLLKPYYKGRSALFNRLTSFLFSNYPQGLVDFGRLDSSPSAVMDLRESRKDIVAAYVHSRKKPQGAEEAINEILDHFLTLRLDGPVVIQLHQAQPSIAQYLILHSWSRGPRSIPCVILTKAHASWQKPEFTLERDEYKKSELFELVSGATGNPVDEIEKTWSFWSATQSRFGRTDRNSTSVSVNEGARFANFIREFDTSNVELDDIVAAMPQRVIAPIMFREDGANISLDHRAVNDAPLAHVIGGARALRNQIAEVLAAGIVDNSVPSANATFNRVSSVLERIITTGQADDSDVIELGVEFSYLEGKVYEAAERIGALSRGPLLGFIGEMSRYLGRFECWAEYQEKGGSEPELAVDVSIAEASVQILTAAISDGVLTPEATSRVQATVDDDDLFASAGKRQGATRSTESLGAVMGRSVLNAGKRGVGEFGDEVRKRAVTELADSSEAFLKKNAGHFLKLAATRSGQWLAMLLEHLGDQ